MAYGRLMYVKEAVTAEDIMRFGREIAALPNIEAQYLPQRNQINALREGVLVFFRLVQRGDYGDWFLDDAQDLGVPFAPQSIISILISATGAPISYALAIEVVERFAQHWTCALDNEQEGDARRIYTNDDFAHYARIGIFPA